ncbi:MAG TPA: hypothetical protein VKU41_00530 [Polyangiaceae bacterium]|nr:hypothetical protein [Polyangiaceae bacterium]
MNFSVLRPNSRFARACGRVVPLGALAWVACAGSPPPRAPEVTSLRLGAQPIHLRAVFDRDPSIYVGRFVPDGTRPEDVDENNAVSTRCSKFIKPRVVDARQTDQELAYASRTAGASLGIPMVGGIAGSREAAATVLVRYDITRRIQSDVDADGLARCCAAEPSQCTQTIIGEFVMGTGSVLQSKSSRDALGVEATSPQGVRAGVTAGADDVWRDVKSFRDVYFGFQTAATPMRLSAAAALSGSDCSWCENIPTSLDGKYFCGVSPDAASEGVARDLAMRSAREQVVKYLGETIVTSSTTRQGAKGILDDQQVVTAAAQGVASHVEGRTWCKPERVATPDGQMVRSKVLAFLPNEDARAAAHDMVDAAVKSLKSAGRLAPQQEDALRSLPTK